MTVTWNISLSRWWIYLPIQLFCLL